MNFKELFREMQHFSVDGNSTPETKLPCMETGTRIVMHKRSETELMLEGYGLTTAKVLYHLPDHPHLLQTFVWQQYDIAPKFPALRKFIGFWRDTLDGPLHSVTYTHRRLVSPTEWRNVTGELTIQ